MRAFGELRDDAFWGDQAGANGLCKRELKVYKPPHIEDKASIEGM
ncbi:hypothetical protein RLEG3_21770 [Rhizobium leguminosarum bv. trifolii WSM1689]|nr:hypothetical protein RLEG3_21770 [Rhizobium leguminosarum bv. trifolii WSM1689]